MIICDKCHEEINNKEFNPEPHIKRGYININDNVTFKYQKDALRCFGYKGGHYQQAVWKIPKTNKRVWFPKLDIDEDWNNSLSNDGEKITMKLNSGESLDDWFRNNRGDKNWLKKIKNGEDLKIDVVFGSEKNHLNQRVYKFIGEFEVSSEETDEFSMVSIRKATKVYLS